MAARFEGKVVLVTGAGSGIGRATAERFYADGARVVLVDVNAKGIQETVAGMPDDDRVHTMTVDLSQPEACHAVVAETIKTFGQLDVLCNIAGILVTGRIEDITPEAWQRILQVNLTSVFFLCQAAVPELAKTRGNIINMASSAALVGQAYAIPYGVTKAGVAMLTKSLAMEVAERGIRVNAVCPGAVNTPLAAAANFPKDANPRLIDKLMSFFGFAEPAEIASLVAFMASDEARYMSGSVVPIDGAQTAG
ncbi:MAG TPA: SDR family NAD(P)-dependent oxidoreductase [Pseudomonadales bacterium]|jgi:meso-butanediol dehydrogenase/(S,S)-butanediol dehydrogenase/diacetyl reductase